MDDPLHRLALRAETAAEREVPRLPLQPGTLEYLALDGKTAYKHQGQLAADRGALADQSGRRRLPAAHEPPQLALPDRAGRGAAYRFSPTLLVWLAVALGAASVLAAAWFARRGCSSCAHRAVRTIEVEQASALERALALLRWAHEQGDETLQRKAFERVAGELGVEAADELLLIARELAWSSRTPEDIEVEEFAEQALGRREGRRMTLPTVHRRGVAGLADLPRLKLAARRTSAVRLALVLALAGTLAALVLVARSAGAGRAAVIPEGASTGVVVLDMSASISGPTYARVATTLRGIVDANQSIGLVMFSDSAYELLPPNSPPGALLQFIPFFVPLRYYGSTPVFEQTPWDTFMGGTRASTGLAVARRALRRAHVSTARSSSSATSTTPRRPAQLDRRRSAPPAAHPGTDRAAVRTAPLDRLFTALFGPTRSSTRGLHAHRGDTSTGCSDEPWGLLALGGLLVLLLAANERWNARLEVKAVTA